MIACCRAAACPRWSASSILTAVLFLFQALLDDHARPRSWCGSAASSTSALSARVYESLVRLPLQARPRERRPAAVARSRQCPLVPVGRAVRPRFSICLGCRSISPSASLFHLLIGVTACAARSCWSSLTALDRVADPRARSRPPPRMAAVAQRARGSQPAQCRGDYGDGHGRRIAERWREANRELPRAASRRASDVAGGLGALAEVAADDAAIGGARRRRLSRDQQEATRRHHHRGFDPGGARAGAGRSRDRQLEGVSWRRARAGVGSTSCSRRCRRRRSGCRCRRQRKHLDGREC